MLMTLVCEQNDCGHQQTEDCYDHAPGQDRLFHASGRVQESGRIQVRRPNSVHPLKIVKRNAPVRHY